MIDAVDRIVLAVPDLPAAVAEYSLLLGDPLPQQARAGVPVARFVLSNSIIELVQSAGDAATIRGIVFASESAAGSERAISNTRGLDIRLARLSHAARPGPGVEGFRVDHLVLRTGSAVECIDLFSGELGVRLALDRTVPEWGGRMLFFRVGKLTLEVIESQREKTTVDYFWGIAYHCADLEKSAAQLSARGIALSEIRAGRKQGTVVATVKSHCLDIPTLLIAPAGGAGSVAT